MILGTYIFLTLSSFSGLRGLSLIHVKHLLVLQGGPVSGCCWKRQSFCRTHLLFMVNEKEVIQEHRIQFIE